MVNKRVLNLRTGNLYVAKHELIKEEMDRRNTSSIKLLGQQQNYYPQ